MPGSVSQLLRQVVAYALPPRCAGCGEPVAEDHQFCGACWSGMRFLGPPWCAGCRLPFAFHRGEEARCAACLSAPPRHAGVHAAVAYGDTAAALAVRLKHGGRIALAETMARSMARWMPADAELLVPVPLHRWRLWTRGFNQAALIADALSRRTGVPRDHRLLVRVRRTRLLRGLGRRARARTVAGAFAVEAAGRAAVRGRRIVLVDDVYTTGATADGCVRALRRAGAASVTILCWARVLPETAD
ncbi:ComF family protein [Sphingomonas rubra]|uniref:ComF family protein n=1 Tax=Sphingomonas rubra TaxID=634430 RepID=A0A1I5PSJ3_9SPHN|nr:ComF family protein [Sphingomonas rubra]SFP36924.1 comF family protein [Sphingomonas rubra]